MATQQQQPADHPAVSIELNATDLVGAAGVMASLVAAALFKRLRTMGRQLREASRPSLLLPRDLVRSRELLAQLAVLTEADRALLGLFHNGSLSETGYHLSKLQIVSGYFGPGIEPVSEYLRVIPVTAIVELRMLWASSDGRMTASIDDPGLLPGCRSYLELRGIHCLRNIVLKAGEQVEVGVIGLHYCRKACPTEAVLDSEPVQRVVAELSRLATLRSTHPSALGVMHLQN